MRCIPRPCARRNLLPPRWVSLRRLLPDPASRPSEPAPVMRRAATVGTPIVDQRICRSRFPSFTRWHTALSRRAPPLCGSRVDRSAMARCGFCMQHVWAIVAHVRSVSSVKNRQPPSKRDGSVPSIGLSLHVPQPQVGPFLHQGNLHLCHWFLILCGCRRLAASLASARVGEAPWSPACRHPTGSNIPTGSPPASATCFPCTAGTLATFVERRV